MFWLLREDGNQADLQAELMWADGERRREKERERIERERNSHKFTNYGQLLSGNIFSVFIDNILWRLM